MSQLDEKGKERLRKSISKKLAASQNDVRSHPKLIKELKQLYYKETNPALAKGYQKYFAECIWQLMIIPFKEKKGPAQEKVVKYFTQFAKEAGTASDLEKYGFSVPNIKPFFVRVLQLYEKQHADARTLVRLRRTHLVYDVLAIHWESFHLKKESGKSIMNKVMGALKERMMDKVPAVRSMALKTIQFFASEMRPDILQDLKYHANYEPDAEARKSAFQTLSKFSNTPLSFIIKKIYDTSENIRMEAFKVLVSVPLEEINTRLIPIIHWGLLQPAGKVRRILVKELVPSWIKDCRGIIQFLIRLDVGRNARTACLLLNAMYPDDSETTFSEVDYSFLTKENLIPIDQVTVEKTFYWVFLCKKFGNRPFCREKVYPDVAKLLKLMKMLIKVIHRENEAATRENRGENIENIFCLAQMLRIAEICHYEEGSKREILDLLRTILLDKILDESPMIHTCVDLVHKIIEPDEFNPFMITVINKVLEAPEFVIPIKPEPEQVEEEGEDEDDSNDDGDDDDDVVFIAEVRANGSTNANAGVHRNNIQRESNQPQATAVNNMEVNDDDVMITGSSNTHFGHRMNNIKKESSQSQAKTTNTNPSTVRCDSVMEIDQDDEVKIIINSRRISSSGSSANVQPNPSCRIEASRPLTEYEIRELRYEKGKLAVERHKLQNEKEQAIRENDKVKAANVDEKVADLQVRVKEIEVILEKGVNSINQITTANRPDTPEVARNDEQQFNDDSAVSFTPNHATSHPGQFNFDAEERTRDDENDYEEEARRTLLPLSRELRGIVIFFRFLTWQQEIIPFTRKLYENYIFACLEEDEPRTRLYAVLIIGLIGLIDVAEAKKSLLVMIHAIGPDEDVRVRAAAFKVIVDLLLRHPFETFRLNEEELEQVDVWPYPLSNFREDTSVGEMEKLILPVLQSFPGKIEIKPKDKILRYLGLMKLLIRGRIRNESEGVLMELIVLWLDPKFTGTPLLKNISYFLPVYAKMGVENAHRVGKIVIQCVKKCAVTAEDEGSNEETEDETKDGKVNNLLKLADFVFPHISPEALSRFKKGSSVHSQLAIEMITEISEHIDVPDRSLIFVKMIKKLDMNEPHVTQLRWKIDGILKEIPTYEGSKSLQSSMTSLQKQLEKKFGPLNEAHSEDNEDTFSKVDSDVGDFEMESNVAENLGQLTNQQEQIRLDYQDNNSRSDQTIFSDEDMPETVNSPPSSGICENDGEGSDRANEQNGWSDNTNSENDYDEESSS